MTASIGLVMRGFHAAQWNGELQQLGISSESISALLNAMART
jgi:hypothetical protein